MAAFSALAIVIIRLVEANVAINLEWIAGPLFVHAGLHAAYALIAALATFASVNFIVATRMPGAQEAA